MFNGRDTNVLYNSVMPQQNLNLRARRLAAVSACLSAVFALSACDWVDSAGRDNNAAPETEIILGDGQAAGPQVLIEETTAAIAVRGTDVDGSVRSWQWSSSPVEQGNLAACSSVPDYQSNLAADSLLEACASNNDCRMEFELQSNESDIAEFVLRTPTLIAPVGLSFRLTATDNNGGKGVTDYTFCLLSVNDAPEPVDDTFTVLEGELLDISGNDLVNLLSNDKDDTDDVNSKPLRVVTTAVTLPASADVFELRDDGGFSYSFQGANLIQAVTDRFEYSVTDGQYIVNAAVTINVVARNDEPIANGTISNIEEIAGIDFSLDFADFYSDPEGNTLGFSVLSGSFPVSGEIELSPIGVLGGIGEPIDVGDYVYTMLITDGVASTTSEISLTILDNEPVTALAIVDEEAEVDSSISVAVGSRFSDPEAQPLVYRLDSSDDEVNLTINSPAGVITGFISVAGEYDVDVSADDGYNTPTTTTMTFVVEAENAAPLFSGLIHSQDVDFGDAIDRIRPVFTDPDGDRLTYRLQGLSPTGLTLSSSGQLTGVPRQTGDYTLRIIAIDPGGLSARSNTFILSVER
ncbi:MAG: putative Ig domain-containing protein [Granulosicoccaceae bacterium]